MSHRDFILAIHAYLDTIRAHSRQAGWLEHLKQGKFYFRLTKHVLEGQVVSTLDIANFEIYPEYQSKGYFKMLLWAAERYCVNNRIEAIYVESVLNPIVDKYLRACDYKQADNVYPESLYKMVAATTRSKS